ncbi:MAG: hypothetical protein QNJ54_06855 [Prochloraceae cyanobacterium]|nr:hypothetical protein [Prochloraceae cyanobacterium]
MVTTQQKTSTIKALFMGQTDLRTGLWFPIKKMTWKYINGEYLDCVTRFTVGAQKLQSMYPNDPYLITFGSLERVRVARNLSSCSFANRMPVNRPVEPQMLEVLGLDPNSPVDPVEYVSRSGGYRHGDNNDLFPEVRADENGNYNFYFRPVSSYQFASLTKPDLNSVVKGDRVRAIIGESKTKLQCQSEIIGSTPGYINELIKQYQDALEITIEKVNRNVPVEYQFLCKARLDNLKGKPFSEMEYQPIIAR